MNVSWTDATLAWIALHRFLAGIVIFAIACSDALLILGAIVPALPLLFAIGVLIGMGKISGMYAVMCAGLGACCGDGVSYWVGRRWGNRLYSIWPFTRHPQLLARGAALFARNAIKSLIVARFVGAIRPFVPAIAGIYGMSLRRYLPTSLSVSFAWAGVFLLPGWMLGQAYGAVAAVAGPLFVVVSVSVIITALLWFALLWAYRMLYAVLRHISVRLLPVLPRTGDCKMECIRMVCAETPDILVRLLFLACVVIVGVLCVFYAAIHHGSLGIDAWVGNHIASLNNPLLDAPMAVIAMLTNWRVLLGALIPALVFLAWRRRWDSIKHALVTLCAGTAITWVANYAVLHGIFPNITQPSYLRYVPYQLSWLVLVWGYLSLILTKQLPRIARFWPHVLTGSVVFLILLASLYIGFQPLGALVVALLVALMWIVACSVMFPPTSLRAVWITPFASVFYIFFAIAALLWVPQRADDVLVERQSYVSSVMQFSIQRWLASDWQRVPSTRHPLDNLQYWPLDVQFVGGLETLKQHLVADGWYEQRHIHWQQLLRVLDRHRPPMEVPVLLSSFDTHAEVLMMLKPIGPERLYVLRMWPSAVRLFPGNHTMWVGSAQTLQYNRYYKTFHLWQPENNHRAALEAVEHAMESFTTMQVHGGADHAPTLLINSSTSAALPVQN